MSLDYKNKVWCLTFLCAFPSDRVVVSVSLMLDSIGSNRVLDSQLEIMAVWGHHSIYASLYKDTQSPGVMHKETGDFLNHDQLEIW